MLIQVNISDEQSKSGISLAELDALAAQVVELPGLCLRGLMAIPAPEADYERQFAVARQMAVAFDALKVRYPGVDTLSLGMSDDMQAAIAAGSTTWCASEPPFLARAITQKTKGKLRNAMNTLSTLLSLIIEAYDGAVAAYLDAVGAL